MSSLPYDSDFYRSLDKTAEPSARVIVPLMMSLAPIGSVVDLGCGDGGWLSVFQSAGATEIQGFDGPWIDDELLKIDPAAVTRVRLGEDLPVTRTYDLAMSLEVAEHLSPDAAARFVSSLTKLAPLVLFSAAIPGQGGEHHVNEQWPDYWAKHFAQQGYVAVDCIRRQIWNNPDVAWWYKQNILIYASPKIMDANPRLAEEVTLHPSPLVHPDLFRMTLKVAHPKLSRWLKMAPSVVARSFGGVS